MYDSPQLALLKGDLDASKLVWLVKEVKILVLNNIKTPERFLWWGNLFLHFKLRKQGYRPIYFQYDGKRVVIRLWEMSSHVDATLTFITSNVTNKFVELEQVEFKSSKTKDSLVVHDTIGLVTQVRHWLFPETKFMDVSNMLDETLASAQKFGITDVDKLMDVRDEFLSKATTIENGD